MNVGTRCESSLRASKDNGADRRVCLELAQCLVELEDKGRAEGIEGFGPVELDWGILVWTLDLECLVV